MLWDAGHETISFYYPLVGQLDEQDDDGAFDMERVGASYLDRSGSILTREPIDFGDRDHIDLDEDTSPNFSGEEMTIAEFTAMAAAVEAARMQDAHTEDVPDDITEDVADKAMDDHIPDDEPTDFFDAPDEGTPDFVPFPDDYPDAYFTLDEADGGDYFFDAPPEDFDGDDPAFVDCDEDEGMGMGMMMF